MNASRLHHQAAERLRAGDLPTARTLYQRLVRMSPRAEHWLTLAQIQIALDDLRGATESLVAAAARQPPIELAARIAGLQFEIGQLADSLETLQSSADTSPDHAGLILLLGQTLEDTGKRDQARQAYQRALELKPRWAAALGGLLRVVREDASEEQLKLARELLADGSLPTDERAVLAYGIGRVHERRRQPDAAFAAWHQANTLRQRVSGPLDRGAASLHIERQMRLFGQARLQNPPKLDRPTGYRPVFIVGMPRSGTTLLEQILASHDEVNGFGELPIMARIAARLDAAARRAGSSDEQSADYFPRPALQHAVNLYYDELDRRCPGRPSVSIDKAPLNFFHAGLIAWLFPEARILVCRRDPRDVCLSIYSENFGLDQGFATDLDDLVFFHHEYERLTDYWLERLPERMREVQYESLVADPEPVLRPLLEWLELDWQPECLDFHRRTDAVLTPSRWQVRSPLYRTSIGRWKEYRAHVAPLLKAFGDD